MFSLATKYAGPCGQPHHFGNESLAGTLGGGAERRAPPGWGLIEAGNGLVNAAMHVWHILVTCAECYAPTIFSLTRSFAVQVGVLGLSGNRHVTHTYTQGTRGTACVCPGTLLLQHSFPAAFCAHLSVVGAAEHMQFQRWFLVGVRATMLPAVNVA
jgi:hypothetical protein